jgi:hypothetical protein
MPPLYWRFSDLRAQTSNHPEREHVTDIVCHYAAPACGTKFGYVDQPSGRYSSAKPGSKNLSTALGAFSAEAHLSQFGRKAKTRLRYYVPPP